MKRKSKPKSKIVTHWLRVGKVVPLAIRERVAFVLAHTFDWEFSDWALGERGIFDRYGNDFSGYVDGKGIVHFDVPAIHAENFKKDMRLLSKDRNGYLVVSWDEARFRKGAGAVYDTTKRRMDLLAKGLNASTSAAVQAAIESKVKPVEKKVRGEEYVMLFYMANGNIQIETVTAKNRFHYITPDGLKFKFSVDRLVYAKRDLPRIKAIASKVIRPNKAAA